MKFSLNWLQDYFDFKVSAEVFLEKLTLAGTEVEHSEVRGCQDDKIVVGQIVRFSPHPNADRLSICEVEDGQGLRQVVCGAKNFQQGDKVPLALPGAKVMSSKEGKFFTIKAGKLRGEKSEGMLCSANELLLAEDAEGLLILPPEAPVGRPLHEVVSGDTLFEVEITPNRPDLLSYQGLARELGALEVGSQRELEAKPIAFPSNPSDGKVKLEAPQEAPFYSATLLTGVQVGPSPDWLKEKIFAMGRKPINNVVDLTNFVLFETGQPLHAFDQATLSGSTLSVRLAQEGESLMALDDKEYALVPEDLVIADEKGVLALAGIMGGKASSVTEATQEVLLEAAWFAPSSVRRTSRRLGLFSDAAYRFERRVDPQNVLKARDRAIELFLEVTGASLASAPLVEGELSWTPPQVVLRFSEIKRVLGLELPPEQVHHWLTLLGLTSQEKTAEHITYAIPSFRPDLEREIDLIEEVSRLHGLETLPPAMNLGLAPESEADCQEDRLTSLREKMAGQGWNECRTDTLVASEAVDLPSALALSHPLNEQATHLRTSLKHSLLEVGVRNLDRGVSGVRLFEIGQVYQLSEGEPMESLHLGILVAGEIEQAQWYQQERVADFFDLKGLEDLLEKEEALWPSLLVESTVLSRVEMKKYGSKVPLFYAEYDLSKWITSPQASITYAAIPSYPQVRRDLAVVVPRSTSQEAVRDAILAAKIPSLNDVHLFDVFIDEQGGKIPVDQKSLAYALTYRASDRTLTEKEVNRWQDQLRQKLQAQLSCHFRESQNQVSV